MLFPIIVFPNKPPKPEDFEGGEFSVNVKRVNGGIADQNQFQQQMPASTV